MLLCYARLYRPINAKIMQLCWILIFVWIIILNKVYQLISELTFIFCKVYVLLLYYYVRCQQRLLFLFLVDDWAIADAESSSFITWLAQLVKQFNVRNKIEQTRNDFIFMLVLMSDVCRRLNCCWTRSPSHPCLLYTLILYRVWSLLDWGRSRLLFQRRTHILFDS